jgi:hypothetical protein
MGHVKLPADVEIADRLAFGLTGKQLGILAATALAGYGAYLLLHTLLPAPVALVPLVLIAIAGGTLALVRHDGLSGDQLALAIGRHLLTPKRQVLAPDGLPTPLPGSPTQPRVAALEIPVRRILTNGVVETADGGYRLLLAARGTSFELRTPVEQEAFVGCFRRFLDARTDPIQLAVSTEPVTLAANAQRIEQTLADAAATAGLREAGLDHAAYLRNLADTHLLRRRRIVVVLTTRERDTTVAAATLTRLATEATGLLAGAGVTLHRLNGTDAARLLARSLDPPGPVDGSHQEGVIRAKPLLHPKTQPTEHRPAGI